MDSLPPAKPSALAAPLQELVNAQRRPLGELALEPGLARGCIEDAVAERQDDVGVDAALAAALWVGPWTDGLGVIALVARVERGDPWPALLSAGILDPVTGLEELKPAPALLQGVVPRVAERATDQARALDREQVLLIPAELEAG